MKSFRRVAAGALVAAGILTPLSMAHAVPAVRVKDFRLGNYP